MDLLQIHVGASSKMTPKFGIRAWWWFFLNNGFGHKICRCLICVRVLVIVIINHHLIRHYRAWWIWFVKFKKKKGAFTIVFKVMDSHKLSYWNSIFHISLPHKLAKNSCKKTAFFFCSIFYFICFLFNSSCLIFHWTVERCLLYSMRLWGDNIEALRIASGTIFNVVADLFLWWFSFSFVTFGFWIYTYICIWFHSFNLHQSHPTLRFWFHQ